MKKITTLLVALICISTSIPIYAQENSPLLGEGILENPYEFWETNGYPDNISFAQALNGYAFIDGKPTIWYIGIIDADETSRQEVINLISSKCSVVFIDCTHTHEQRQAAFNAIRDMQDEKIINVTFAINVDKILVIVSDEDVADYEEVLFAQFGDIVIVISAMLVTTYAAKTDVDISDNPIMAVYVSDDGYVAFEVEPDTIYNESEGSKQNNWVILPTILLLLCGVTIILYFNRSRLMLAPQTDNGNFIASNTRISRKQTIAAIKDSTLTPSVDVFRTIKEKI